MVNSVVHLKSCFSQGITPFPDFEMLDARISALNKTIQYSYFKKKVSLKEKKLKKQTDSFAEDRSFASLYTYSIMLTYSRLFFGMTIFRSSTRDGMKFYCLWSNSHLMTFLESLYKFRSKLKTVLELCNLEIHQKNAKPDYHKLKTKVKSIEQHFEFTEL